MTSLRSWPTNFRTSGHALDIGAGEGRNALFLASRGLNVLAVDQSEVGMQKAQRLAQERGLTLRTQAADLQDFDAEHNSFDVISSIFVHLPATLRAAVHKRVGAWLKPGGVFLLEAYAPDQIERRHRRAEGPVAARVLGGHLRRTGWTGDRASGCPGAKRLRRPVPYRGGVCGACSGAEKVIVVPGFAAFDLR